MVSPSLIQRMVKLSVCALCVSTLSSCALNTQEQAQQQAFAHQVKLAYHNLVPFLGYYYGLAQTQFKVDPDSLPLNEQLSKAQASSLATNAIEANTTNAAAYANAKSSVNSSTGLTTNSISDWNASLGKASNQQLLGQNQKPNQTQDALTQSQLQTTSQPQSQTVKTTLKSLGQAHPLLQALQQAGATVCLTPQCESQAVPLQSYISFDAEQSFILIELLSPDLTLQRLYTNYCGTYIPAGPTSVITSLRLQVPQVLPEQLDEAYQVYAQALQQEPVLGNAYTAGYDLSKALPTKEQINTKNRLGAKKPQSTQVSQGNQAAQRATKPTVMAQTASSTSAQSQIKTKSPTTAQATLVRQGDSNAATKTQSAKEQTLVASNQRPHQDQLSIQKVVHAGSVNQGNANQSAEKALPSNLSLGNSTTGNTQPTLGLSANPAKASLQHGAMGDQRQGTADETAPVPTTANNVGNAGMDVSDVNALNAINGSNGNNQSNGSTNRSESPKLALVALSAPTTPIPTTSQGSDTTLQAKTLTTPLAEVPTKSLATTVSGSSTETKAVISAETPSVIEASTERTPLAGSFGAQQLSAMYQQPNGHAKEKMQQVFPLTKTEPDNAKSDSSESVISESIHSNMTDALFPKGKSDAAVSEKQSDTGQESSKPASSPQLPLLNIERSKLQTAQEGAPLTGDALTAINGMSLFQESVSPLHFLLSKGIGVSG